jgi:6-phosphofructokinase 1
MKKIAVLTSGGDAPGMNACIRAVVRTALYHNMEVVGFIRGYEGMIDADYIPMQAKSVANIIQRGGTILKTSRSERFITLEGRKQAAANLQKIGVEGIVVIGGDGSFRGALALKQVTAIPIVGCPGTIDNDLWGTDFTIGYDTAVNTVIEAVDKIRDTAESHDRLFLVEVMGRDAGLIALRSGISVGAEAILIPEKKTDVEDLIKRLENGRKDKASKIIIVSEHDDAGGAFAVAEKIKKQLPYYDTRVTVLGHLQRGGNPTCIDRVNASRIGYAAVEALIAGKEGVMVGIVNKEITYTPFEKSAKHLEELDPALMKMVDILSM